jgi:hypothetical protein
MLFTLNPKRGQRPILIVAGAPTVLIFAKQLSATIGLYTHKVLDTKLDTVCVATSLCYTSGAKDQIKYLRDEDSYTWCLPYSD